MIEAAASRWRALVIVSGKLSPQAIGLLTHINKTPERFQAIAIQLPADRVESAAMLEDLTTITAALPYLQATHANPAKIQPGHLGTVRSVWANRDVFCVVEDADDGAAGRQLLESMLQRYQVWSGTGICAGLGD